MPLRPEKNCTCGRNGQKKEKKSFEAKRQSHKTQNVSESWYGFHPLSSTEGEAGDEERYRVSLLSVRQVGAKHQL